MRKLLLQGLYPCTKQTDNLWMLQQFGHIFVFDSFLLRIVLDKPVHRNDQSRNKLPLICDNSNLINITVYHQFGFQCLRSNIFTIRCLKQILNALCQE